MIKAVIFDMDGTMVNTEILWRNINHQLAAHYGKVFDESMRVQMMGKKDYDALTVFKEFYSITASVEELVEKRRKMVLDNVTEVKMNSGLFELLDLLDQLHIKKAVATSAFKEFSFKILNTFHITARVEVIVTGDEVKKGKPAPDIFLETAKRLNVDPSESLVIEDAQNGVDSAYNAHMKVIAIPHTHSSHHDFSKATKILHSMLDIDEKLLKSL